MCVLAIGSRGRVREGSFFVCRPGNPIATARAASESGSNEPFRRHGSRLALGHTGNKKSRSQAPSLGKFQASSAHKRARLRQGCASLAPLGLAGPGRKRHSGEACTPPWRMGRRAARRRGESRCWSLLCLPAPLGRRRRNASPRAHLQEALQAVRLIAASWPESARGGSSSGRTAGTQA